MVCSLSSSSQLVYQQLVIIIIRCSLLAIEQHRSYPGHGILVSLGHRCLLLLFRPGHRTCLRNTLDIALFSREPHENIFINRHQFQFGGFVS